MVRHFSVVYQTTRCNDCKGADYCATPSLRARGNTYHTFLAAITLGTSSSETNLLGAAIYLLCIETARAGLLEWVNYLPTHKRNSSICLAALPFVRTGLTNCHTRWPSCPVLLGGSVESFGQPQQCKAEPWSWLHCNVIYYYYTCTSFPFYYYYMMNGKY